MIVFGYLSLVDLKYYNQFLVRVFAWYANSPNFKAAKLAHKKQYKKAISLIDSYAKLNRDFLKDLYLPLTLQQEIIDKRITEKDAPFLASKFNFPEKLDIEKSVVRIVVGDKKDEIDAIGSGFFITDELILTNSHVINKDSRSFKSDYMKYIYVSNLHSINTKYISAKNFFKTAYKAEVIAEDMVHDMALLKINNNKTEQKIKIENHVSNGYGNTFAIGYPLFNEDKTTKNLLKTVPYISAGYFNRIFSGMLETSNPNGPGGSGGPIVNSCNHLIGLFTSGISGTGLTMFDKNYYTDAFGGSSRSKALPEDIINFLEKNKVAFKKSKNCLPFNIPTFDSTKLLTRVIRFNNSSYSTVLIISQRNALFVAPNSVNIGDDVFVEVGLGIMGKVKNIDKKTRLALFEISLTDKSNTYEKDFIRILSKYETFNKTFALPNFSAEEFSFKRDMFFSAFINPRNTPKDKFIIKRTQAGHVYSKRNTFPAINGIFDGQTKNSKKLKYNYNKLDVTPKLPPPTQS